MIKIQLLDYLPYYQNGMTIKKTTDSLPIITEPIISDSCPLIFGGGYEHFVFCDISGDERKNDKNEFLFKKFISSDVVNLEIWFNGTKLANLTDNTFGRYFGAFTGNYTQALQKGYLIDWLKVFLNNGYGAYKIKAKYTVVGVAREWESDTFNLMNFSEELSNRTVKIKSIQNGNIMGSIFDYTGLNWHQEIRLNGVFFEDAETLEKTNYLTQNYEQLQITSEIKENWILTLDFSSRNITEFLIKDRLLSNEIYISDYSLSAEKIHNLQGVYPESIEKTKLIDNKKSKYLIKFTSKVKNLIKRNF